MIDIDLRLTLTAGQRTAWATIRPVIKPYLVKIFRLYRAATLDQRAALLAHNPILAAVVDMVGDE